MRVQLAVDEHDRDLLPPQLVQRGVVLDGGLDDLDLLGRGIDRTRAMARVDAVVALARQALGVAD